MRLFSLFLVGCSFAAGLVIAGMTQPEKVLAFLDVFGKWDPALGFVLGSALISTYFGYRVVLKRPNPLFVDRFDLPGTKHIDIRLLAGASLFGIGWGLSGLCPGPAIVAVGSGNPEIIIFTVAMFAGFLAKDVMDIVVGSGPPTLSSQPSARA